MSKSELRHFVGIDLGGTKIEVGILDETGIVYDKERIETDVKGGAKVIERDILGAIADLRSKNSVKLMGVGIGIPGQIDPVTGNILFAPNLKWHNVPLKSNLEKALELPITIVNDVRAITFGEWIYGEGKGEQDLLCVYVGTGIGGGVVIGGRLLEGASGTFGEVGHITIDLDGPICSCGKRGCFESLAGGWGIGQHAQDAIRVDERGEVSQMMLKMAGGDVNNVTARIVIEAWKNKDPLGTRLMNNVMRALVAGLSSLVNLYNPRVLILGGGVIDGMEEIIPTLEEGIRKNALEGATSCLKVVKSSLGKEAGVIGSAAAIFHSLKNEYTFTKFAAN